MVADAWEWAMAVGAYGYRPMTVGYYKGAAYVRVWNWRNGNLEWRRHPVRDVPPGSEPKPSLRDIFSCRELFHALAGR